MHGEDPEPAPHIQRYFVGHYLQSSSVSEASKSEVPDSPPFVPRRARSSDAFHDRPVPNTNLDALLELPKLLVG